MINASTYTVFLPGKHTVVSQMNRATNTLFYNYNLHLLSRKGSASPQSLPHRQLDRTDKGIHYLTAAELMMPSLCKDDIIGLPIDKVSLDYFTSQCKPASVINRNSIATQRRTHLLRSCSKKRLSSAAWQKQILDTTGEEITALTKRGTLGQEGQKITSICPRDGNSSNTK